MHRLGRRQKESKMPKKNKKRKIAVQVFALHYWRRNIESSNDGEIFRQINAGNNIKIIDEEQVA